MARAIIGFDLLLILIVLVVVGTAGIGYVIRRNRYRGLPTVCSQCDKAMYWYEAKELDVDTVTGKMFYKVYRVWRCAEGHEYLRLSHGRAKVEETV